jgi:hypothetical protein
MTVSLSPGGDALGLAGERAGLVGALDAEFGEGD